MAKNKFLTEDEPEPEKKVVLGRLVDARAFSSCFDNPIIQVQIKPAKVLKNRIKEVLGFEF